MLKLVDSAGIQSKQDLLDRRCWTPYGTLLLDQVILVNARNGVCRRAPTEKPCSTPETRIGQISGVVVRGRIARRSRQVMRVDAGSAVGVSREFTSS